MSLSENLNYKVVGQYAVFLKGAFSQWKNAPFSVDGVNFLNNEMYMMFQKASIFQDYETGAKILETTRPKEAKALGRQVRGFNQQIWDQVKFGIVYSGTYHKFNFHKELREILFQTKGLLIVEANPYDLIWSCGLSEDDPDIVNREKWKGKNLLGWALTSVREIMLFRQDNPQLFEI